MGFLSDLWGKAKNYVTKNIYEPTRRFLTGGSNYIGPFNRLDTDYLKSNKPIDKVDEGAMFHDLDYSRIATQRDKGNLTKGEANKLIRESDERFLENTKRHATQNPLGAGLGYLGIWGKNKLEDLGILDPNQFVTARLGGLIEPIKFDLPKKFYLQ